MKKKLIEFYFYNSYDYIEVEESSEIKNVSSRFNYLIFLEKGSIDFTMLNYKYHSEKPSIILLPSYIEVNQIIFKNATYKMLCFDNSVFNIRKNKHCTELLRNIVDENIYYFESIMCLEIDKLKRVEKYFEIIRLSFKNINNDYLKNSLDVVLISILEVLVEVKNTLNKTYKLIDIKRYIWRYIYLMNQENNVFKKFSDNYFLSLSYIRNYCYAINKKKNYFKVNKRG